MQVILIRHTESWKNYHKTFSTDHENEKLTINGIKQAEWLADELHTYIHINNLNCTTIYTAKSKRAAATGMQLSKKLNKDIQYVDEFTSKKVKERFRGISENEVQKRDKCFMDELYLNRAGILNAYCYESNFSKNYIKEYEARVYNKYKEIISDPLENVKIIVMHHSSLTAVMINVAREYYGYPRDFYGNIEAGLGNLYLINYQVDKVSVEYANAEPSSLNQ